MHMYILYIRSTVAYQAHSDFVDSTGPEKGKGPKIGGKGPKNEAGWVIRETAGFSQAPNHHPLLRHLIASYQS